MERCGPEVAALDKAAFGPPVNGDDAWWFDTRRRTWIVQRPFAPGGIDSTHWFDVLYRIDDKVVARWTVDTRERTVSGAVAATQPGR